jgi:type IV pilus assembly protein PilM
MFKEKAISYIGVDIGTSSIKIVELANQRGTPRLVTYGYIEGLEEIKEIGSEKVQKKVSDIIKKICEKSKVQSKKVIGVLPNYSAFHSIVSIPAGLKKDDFVLAIKAAAKKVISLPLEEVYLDWKLLEEPSTKTSDGKEGNIKVLIIAAPKGLVKGYIEIFKNSGLNLINLETEGFALIRSLIGEDKSDIMILDIGFSTTEITISCKGMPLFTRGINIGGDNFTKIIGNSLGLDYFAAEKLKKDVGMSKGKEYPEIASRLIGPIINEINFSFREFSMENEGAQIDKIVLTGGGARMKGLDSYLEENLNKNIVVGDPWSKIIYPMELRPVLKDLAMFFSISIGVAMREI